MNRENLNVMAHLMRRAGFGATRDELEIRLANGYEQTVEDLLNPVSPQSMPDDIIRRYHTDQAEQRQLDGSGGYWLYRMITTDCPSQEKIALFWHSVFATGYSKLNNARSLLNQIDMFRTFGLGSFRDLLVALSKDPAMIVWLDNNDNHDGAINENYGRELLELFSMGIGNYSEEDVKECARAFTGWSLANAEYMSVRASKDSIWPYSRIAWHFEYKEDDHDHQEKVFLGERGNFDGGDIIDIICKQEATARFVSTRLFQFFGADVVNEEGEAVVADMMQAYFDSHYEIRSVLRTLFNSDYFKSHQARFTRIKAPVETVVGTVRLAGSYKTPTLAINKLWSQALFMGQGVLNPPTVEGWHEGVEWIDSGALVERVNFAAQELGDPNKPGVKEIVSRLNNQKDGSYAPEQLVDGCLDLIGPIEVASHTRRGLIEHAGHFGDLDYAADDTEEEKARRVAATLRLVVATPEYQLA